MNIFIALFALLGALMGMQPVQAQEFTFISDRQIDELLAEIKEKSGVTVILIPGILGSKLTVREKDRDVLVWGGVKTYESSLQYDPAQNVEPAIFDKAEIDAFFKTFEYNVYGNAIFDVRDVSPDGRTRVEIYPYDWRQSNVKSADRLQNWICERATKLQGRKIIFVAHSMGGLVLKRWLQTHYDRKATCGQTQLDQILDISQLIFLGTPHAGAPIFISALVDHYELLKDHPVIDAYLSWGLNTYGSSFESIYELLPIVQSKYCQTKKKIDKPAYIYLRTSGLAPEPIDLFQPEIWRSLGIPKQRHIKDENQFYETFLPKQLQRAEQLLCDLWKYDFRTLKDKVTYIYGQENKPSTVTKYILARWRNVTRKTTLWERLNFKSNDVVIDDAINDYGDGTVPTDIASTAPDLKFAHRAESKHQALLDDLVFRFQLRGQIESSKLALIKKATDDDPAKVATVQRYARAHNALVPVGSILAMTAAFQPSSPELAWAVNINTQLLSERQIDWKAFSTLAKRSPDKQTKAEAYAQIIANDAVPVSQRLWSANNLGHLLIADRNYSQADQILAPAASAVQSSSMDQLSKKLVGLLFNNAGWASLRQGKLETAEASFGNAKKFGYGKAKSGLDEVNILKSATVNLQSQM